MYSLHIKTKAHGVTAVHRWDVRVWSLHLPAASHRVSMPRMSISDYRYFEVMGFFFCSSCCSPSSQRYWRKGYGAVNTACPTMEKYWGFWAKWKCFFSDVDLPLSNSGTAACTPTHCTSTSAVLFCSQNRRSLQKGNTGLSLRVWSANNTSFTIFSQCKYRTESSTACDIQALFILYPASSSECMGCGNLKWTLSVFLACHQNTSLEHAESSASSYGITLCNYQLVKFPR